MAAYKCGMHEDLPNGSTYYYSHIAHQHPSSVDSPASEDICQSPIEMFSHTMSHALKSSVIMEDFFSRTFHDKFMECHGMPQQEKDGAQLNGRVLYYLSAKMVTLIFLFLKSQTTQAQSIPIVSLGRDLRTLLALGCNSLPRMGPQS